MYEYPNVNQEYKIMVKINSGKIIILEDGSKWETFPFRGVNNAAFWFENSPILITAGRRSKIITYHLKNLDENETVQGIFLGFAKPEGHI